ncbi:MAG TPA: glycosyl hydrolase family 35 [Marinilabiliales bacterium]|nr:MAG: glycosyl hydrolase family 35 [Bacteroidetes bacterium GWA2_40_14]OFX61132.1 MAG: glycosyl hydrolase family 35 [Bacteroidetes bacterium GWC2_40_13]OFX73060.1 MAG: glycosyl hydrolase family 35 [Bacteroidetes bacterium GWD2_40_43]OFX91538.1 MAG: glycosyl hydrolase family 35 [Bacteroidetes bacterium GWE2_40_63]OFY19699.1 MAG: glycosyl hydrolase family 35 [Bacteroidetes bacterium GWF2_40_13]OFZ25459.1 MAG: glycosyl hydrolase family 35 [Bacteroidetes bacterium RIFOXYC2_FULL_40_12]HAN00411.1
MKRRNTILLVLLSIVISDMAGSQNLYKIDASSVYKKPVEGHFKMGNPGASGKAILVNSQYLTIGGKPVLPVMGEIHFSRIKPELWEDVILKTKANGVNIISTYLFWNQHEEIEGQFEWQHEKDLRSFIELCAKHQMYVVPRLGPWSHGEARNGGTPDWILRKKYLKDRSNDMVYQHYVVRYFTEIAKQLEGLYYKEGGNIIGIQLENEYWYGKKGEPHIKWLKDLAVSLGIDVPIYTVTGWGNGSVPPFEVIPLWGAYADAPWVENVEKLYQPGNYMFDSFRDNKNIGNDRVSSPDEYMSYGLYPYFTCEVGVGVQNTYHRRLVIGPRDGLTMMLAKLGSGSNLLGYYIFAGATQFSGLLHSTEEEQEETGYWSRVPLKSYDFQAAIRESGELSEAYHEVKKLHYFVNEAGEQLAPMLPVIYTNNKNELQLAVRSNNESGFLFGINYARFEPKETRRNASFQVKFKNEILTFPQSGIDIPDSSLFIWPLNYQLGKVKLKYATAQLLTHIGNTFFLFQNGTIPVELAFDATNIQSVDAASAKTEKIRNWWVISKVIPGKENRITLNLSDGSKQFLYIFTENGANQSWVLDNRGTPAFYISESGMYSNQGKIVLFGSKNEEQNVYSFVDAREPHFEVKNVTAPVANHSTVEIKEVTLFNDAQWIETTGFDSIPAYQQRYHRFIFKEFSLDNPSRIRSAILYVYPESGGQLNVNYTWVKQPLEAGRINEIDLTAYVKKGENLLFLDFPYVNGIKKMAARLVVDYYNYNRINICTDASWLANDNYTNPTPLKSYEIPKPAKLSDAITSADALFASSFREWNINIPRSVSDNVQNTYLKLDYSGDRAELYNEHVLVADDFNSNQTWSIGLRGLERRVAGETLRLVIYPLSEKTKIYFDVLPEINGYGMPQILKSEVTFNYLMEVE